MADSARRLGKVQIRQHWRKNFPYSLEERIELSGKIVGFLKTDRHLKKAGQIGLFSPLSWEPDLLALLEVWPAKFAFPRVTSPTTMAFFKIRGLTDLTAGYAGILEPGESAPPVKTWQTDDVLLVPGYGFDVFGGRVGSGRGFYDRFLASFRGIAVGIAFERQISQLPLDQEPFDARMALLCTDQGIRACKSERK